MSVHLVKLCVGVDSVDDLRNWQEQYLKDLKLCKVKPEVIHVTRQMPKREEELLDGGSLYWVIKGHIAVRQRILELRTVVKNGAPHCGIVLDQELVRTLHRFRSPFQGWRYLKVEDAPPDVSNVQGGDMPDALKIELAELGLL